MLAQHSLTERKRYLSRAPPAKDHFREGRTGSAHVLLTVQCSAHIHRETAISSIEAAGSLWRLRRVRCRQGRQQACGSAHRRCSALITAQRSTHIEGENTISSIQTAWSLRQVATGEMPSIAPPASDQACGIAHWCRLGSNS